MSDIILGKLITEPQERDAIHVAIAPVVAAEAMEPGQHIQVNHEGKACSGNKPIGIVDPYLRQTVMPGDKFWIHLYQKTVKNLRHNWSHPAFPEQETIASEKQKDMAKMYLLEFAATWEMDFYEMVKAASAGEGITASGMDIHSWNELGDGGKGFWDNLEIYTGQRFSIEHREGTYISYAC